jgi:phosphoribosylformimino-5-aminoimidazole carboxamide ribotide isomerase
MSKFKIIPVIDILNGIAVHAFKGERNKYKPLTSTIISSPNPITIINELKKNFNFNEFYIADLDSILTKRPNTDLLLDILKIPGLKIMLDPGVSNQMDILSYSKYNLYKLILGLETIESLEIINEAIKIMGKNRLIISIDMYKGKIISKLNDFKDQTPLTHLNKLKNLGIKEIILLDLYRVGQKLGDIPPLYLKIRNNFDGSIFIGGGIKNLNDLMRYKSYHFSGALIATALYDGTIKIEKLKNF